MNTDNKYCKLMWIPRIITTIFILFLSLLALDAFSDETSFSQQFLGFIIHLIPSFVLIIILVLSWKHPIGSGVAFIFIAIVFTLFFDTYENIFSFLTISLGPATIGGLFVILGILRKKE